jgi:NADH dehydrogenase [ubiquinone] 1 alpha subcomplex assembly factor 6
MISRHWIAQKCLSNRVAQTSSRSIAYVLGSNTTNSADPSGYCRDFVRKHDYESFLTSQFYPKTMQGGYFALKAFYVSIWNCLNNLNIYGVLTLCDMEVELAMIQDVVSNSMLGKMRMQFWRDIVKQISDVRATATQDEYLFNTDIA